MTGTAQDAHSKQWGDGDLLAHGAIAKKGRNAILTRFKILKGLLKLKMHQQARELMKCCSNPIPSKKFISIKEYEGKHHIAGLTHCGRHLCPICHPFHAMVRRNDLHAMVGVCWEAGKHFLFTPTARHRRGVKWAELKAAIKIVSRKQQQQRMWKDHVLGFVRADETTFGINGFHFHQHYLLTLKRECNEKVFSEWLKGFWEAELRRAGRSADWSAMGRRSWWVPIRTANAALAVMNYATKEWTWDEKPGKQTPELTRGAVTEVVGAATKGQTPWDWPPAAFGEVWKASKRHRWYGTSGIWRPKNGLELTEEEIELRREAQGEDAAWIRREDWTALSMHDQQEVLAVIHSGIGPTDFIHWLQAFNAVWGGIFQFGSPPS
jgi:hypothetical protein